MEERNLEATISWLFLVGHIGTLGSIIWLTLAGGFDGEEFKTTIGLVLPAFAVYSTTIFKSQITQRYKKHSSHRKVSRQFAITALSLCTLFVLSILSLVYMKAFNIIPNFGEFVLFLTIIETSFAAFLGILIDSLFRKEPKPT